jgi:tripartite-type tricarboxylate transporter receptor subunit TctC
MVRERALYENGWHEMKPVRAWLKTAVALSVLAMTPAVTAQAAGYPEKPLELIEPYPPGSISDIGARILARQLSTELGQPVRVVDAPGANTAVGASKLQQESADGYAIFWDIASQLGYVLANKQLPYKADDYQGVAMLGGESFGIIARADDDRFRSVKDIISWAKAHPGALSVANGGDGDAKKALDDLQAAGQIQAKSIPYSGGSTILTALLGSHVDLGITAPSNATNNPKLRVVTVLTAAKSYPPMPDLITTGAAGLDVDAPLVRGVYVKKGTPPAVIAKLSEATQKVMQSAEWHDFSKRFSQIEAPGDPAATNDTLRKQVAKWEAYLKDHH